MIDIGVRVTRVAASFVTHCVTNGDKSFWRQSEYRCRGSAELAWQEVVTSTGDSDLQVIPHFHIVLSY